MPLTKTLPKPVIVPIAVTLTGPLVGGLPPDELSFDEPFPDEPPPQPARLIAAARPRIGQMVFWSFIILSSLLPKHWPLRRPLWMPDDTGAFSFIRD